MGLGKVVRRSMCVGRGGEWDTGDEGGGGIMLQRQLFELGGNIALFLTKLLLICRATRKRNFISYKISLKSKQNLPEAR